MFLHKLNGLSSLFARTLTLGRASLTAPAALAPARRRAEQSVAALPQCFMQSQRSYNRKKTPIVAPTKPARFDYSGDLDYSMPKVEESSPKYGFEDVDELKSASNEVRDIFSLKFADQREVFKKQLKDTLVTIQEHPADLRSLEVKITSDTLKLRKQVDHMKQFRKDKICKTHLIERIQRRNKMLRILRSRDMEKFEWLLEELRIKYLPLKPMYQYRKLPKRAARKKVARDAYFATKKEKLENLRHSIEEERKEFEEEKQRELSSIQRDLSEMGIHEMASVESVVTALGMVHHLEPKELRMKRRYIILQKKFELWEKNKNKEKLET